MQVQPAQWRTQEEFLWSTKEIQRNWKREQKNCGSLAITVGGISMLIFSPRVKSFFSFIIEDFITLGLFNGVEGQEMFYYYSL